jgi:hypothetical protein
LLLLAKEVGFPPDDDWLRPTIERQVIVAGSLVGKPAVAEVDGAGNAVGLAAGNVSIALTI